MLCLKEALRFKQRFETTQQQNAYIKALQCF